MNWKFWKNSNVQAPGVPKNAKPKELPMPIGRKMVVELEINPDDVWALKYLCRPSENRQGMFEFRLFNPNNAKQSGVVVRDWNTLDNRPDLILYEGRYDKNSSNVEFN